MAYTALFLVSLAAGSAEDTMHLSPHTEHTSVIAGLKLTQITSGLGEDEIEAGIGGIAFAETSIIEGWLEAEISAGTLILSDETVYPFEVLAKKPFHFGDFCPYIAVGPTFDVVRHDSENSTLFGISSALGAYLWLGQHVGVDVEVLYSAVEPTSGDETIHEILVGFGPAWRY